MKKGGSLQESRVLTFCLSVLAARLSAREERKKLKI
jgi:hypothetical protein